MKHCRASVGDDLEIRKCHAAGVASLKDAEQRLLDPTLKVDRRTDLLRLHADLSREFTGDSDAYVNEARTRILVAAEMQLRAFPYYEHLQRIAHLFSEQV